MKTFFIRSAASLLAFLAFVGMGAVIGAAFGATWGTPDAGLCALFTFMFATGAAITAQLPWIEI